MVYVTGDIHGDPRDLIRFSESHSLMSEDTIIILGDAGFNFYLHGRDRKAKKLAMRKRSVLVCQRAAECLDEIACEQVPAARDWKVDVVLSHTCPAKRMPAEAYFSGCDQSKVDNSTEDWFTYQRCYCV